MANKRTDIKKRKDEPKKKNLIWIARENAGLTRKEVEARCPWMTESRLQKIESGTQRMTPDDVHALSAIYGDKELCRTYCQRVCKIGTVCNPADDECKPVAQIVLEMLSALNAANRRKDQLVDIAADGSDLMTAVYIREAVEDYNGFGTDRNGGQVPHRLGCSGIDGVTFAPLPGQTEADGKYLYVAYGVYSELTRCDNDYQVLLCYDTAEWDRIAAPLKQNDMHKNGFDAPLHKFFVFTGNTNYGVQNLEYDRNTDSLYLSVYVGKKPEYPNFPLFAVDLSVPARTEVLRGVGEVGEVLTLRRDGECHEESGVCGYKFKLGATGMYSFGDGDWLFSDNRKCTDFHQCAYIFKYRYVGGKDQFLLDV